MADWGSISQKVNVTALHEALVGIDNIVETLKSFDIIVAMRERTPFPESVLENLPNLKLLVTTGMRNLAIDLKAAKARNITVSGTSSYSEPPVELTWALILALSRNLFLEASNFKSGGPWQSTVGVDLKDKNLGLIGLGKIGSRIARVGSAFGMNVLAWSPNLTAEKANKNGAIFINSKEELIKQSDFLSLHLVLSDTTKNILNRDDLNKMRTSAFLINTSRAGLVDQAALLDTLNRKEIAGAGLDVFDVEPLPIQHALRKLPNVLATPHLGYVTEKNYRAYFTESLENISAFVQGIPFRLL